MSLVEPPNQMPVKAWHPSLQEDYEAIRRQLEEMLEHSLFSHSKRYPAFLRTVVDFASTTPQGLLKERMLGSSSLRAPRTMTRTSTRSSE
jgi:hypothetical protein